MTAVAPRAVAVDVAALLEELVAVPSPTGSEDACATLLASRMAELGFATSRDSTGNVIGTWGDGRPEVLLVGHIDTVPGVVPVGRRDGVLSGRGTVDAKGPLVAAIAAVAAQPWSSRSRCTVVAAVDEEGASRGARALLGRPAPAALVVLEPSGAGAVTIGYRGCLRLRASVERPAAHGAGREMGAADRLVAFIRAVQDLSAAHGGQGITDRLDVRVDGLESSTDGLLEHARASLALRLPVGVSHLALRSRLSAIDPTVALAFEPGCDAVVCAKGSPVVRALVQSIRAAGGDPRYLRKTGTADLNLLAPAWGCPAAAYGPGDASLDHTPEEHIAIDELERGVVVLTGAVRRLVTAAEGGR